MRVRREGAIAIGSNSIRALVANLDGELSDPLRLREETGLYLALEGGRLKADALQRLAGAVERLAMKARDAGAERLQLFATCALREADNAEELESLLQRQLPGLRLHIITGEEEARLSFLGAGLPRFQGPRGLIDLGGGSTELALGDEHGPSLLLSLPLGAARLLAHQPIDSPADLMPARRIVQAVLRQHLPRLDALPARFFLAGGTGTTLLHIARGIPQGQALPEQADVSRSTVEQWLQQLAGMSLAERLALTGMPAGRERILPTGLCILHELMIGLHLEQITVTGRGNLDGFLSLAAQEANLG